MSAAEARATDAEARLAEERESNAVCLCFDRRLVSVTTHALDHFLTELATDARVCSKVDYVEYRDVYFLAFVEPFFTLIANFHDHVFQLLYPVSLLSGITETVGQDQHHPKAVAKDDASARQVGSAAAEDKQCFVSEMVGLN